MSGTDKDLDRAAKERADRVKRRDAIRDRMTTQKASGEARQSRTVGKGTTTLSQVKTSMSGAVSGMLSRLGSKSKELAKKLSPQNEEYDDRHYAELNASDPGGTKRVVQGRQQEDSPKYRSFDEGIVPTYQWDPIATLNNAKSKLVQSEEYSGSDRVADKTDQERVVTRPPSGRTDAPANRSSSRSSLRSEPPARPNRSTSRTSSRAGSRASSIESRGSGRASSRHVDTDDGRSIRSRGEESGNESTRSRASSYASARSAGRASNTGGSERSRGRNGSTRSVNRTYTRSLTGQNSDPNQAEPPLDPTVITDERLEELPLTVQQRIQKKVEYWRERNLASDAALQLANLKKLAREGPSKFTRDSDTDGIPSDAVVQTDPGIVSEHRPRRRRKRSKKSIPTSRILESEYTDDLSGEDRTGILSLKPQTPTRGPRTRKWVTRSEGDLYEYKERIAASNEYQVQEDYQRTFSTGTRPNYGPYLNRDQDVVDMQRHSASLRRKISKQILNMPREELDRQIRSRKYLTNHRRAGDSTCESQEDEQRSTLSQHVRIAHKYRLQEASRDACLKEMMRESNDQAEARGAEIEDIVARFIVNDKDRKDREEEQIRVYHCLLQEQADEYKYRQEQLVREHEKITKNLHSQMRKIRRQRKNEGSVNRGRSSDTDNRSSGTAPRRDYASDSTLRDTMYESRASSITHVSPTDRDSETDVKRPTGEQWTDDRRQSAEIPRAAHNPNAYPRIDDISVSEVDEQPPREYPRRGSERYEGHMESQTRRHEMPNEPPPPYNKGMASTPVDELWEEPPLHTMSPQTQWVNVQMKCDNFMDKMEKHVSRSQACHEEMMGDLQRINQMVAPLAPSPVQGGDERAFTGRVNGDGNGAETQLPPGAGPYHPASSGPQHHGGYTGGHHPHHQYIPPHQGAHGGQGSQDGYQRPQFHSGSTAPLPYTSHHSVPSTSRTSNEGEELVRECRGLIKTAHDAFASIPVPQQQGIKDKMKKRLDKWNFANGDWMAYDSFKTEFNHYRKRFGWSDKDAALELYVALTGRAKQKVNELDDAGRDDVKAMWKALDSVFAPPEGPQAALAKFWRVKMDKGKSFREHVEYLRSLHRKAKPRATESERDMDIVQQLKHRMTGPTWSRVEPFLDMSLDEIVRKWEMLFADARAPIMAEYSKELLNEDGTLTVMPLQEKSDVETPDQGQQEQPPTAIKAMSDGGSYPQSSGNQGGNPNAGQGGFQNRNNDRGSYQSRGFGSGDNHRHGGGQGRGRGPPRDDLFCRYCQKKGHTEDKCWLKRDHERQAKMMADAVRLGNEPNYKAMEELKQAVQQSLNLASSRTTPASGSGN